MVMDQNLEPIQIDVVIVEETVEYAQTKVFLLFSKLVPNVQEVERKLQIHVQIVVGREINRFPKKYL